MCMSYREKRRGGGGLCTQKSMHVFINDKKKIFICLESLNDAVTSIEG